MLSRGSKRALSITVGLWMVAVAVLFLDGFTIDWAMLITLIIAVLGMEIQQIYKNQDTYIQTIRNTDRINALAERVDEHFKEGR